MSDAAAGNRTQTLLLAGLAALVVGAVFVFVVLPLLTGDDAPDDTDVVVVDDESPAPAATPSEDFELADPDEVDGELPAETFEVFNARDPFQQLVDASPGGGTGTGGTPGDAGTPGVFPPTTPGTSPGTTPTTDPGTGDTPPPGTSPGTGDGSAPPPDTSGDGSGTGSDGSDGSGGSDGASGSDGSSGSNGSDAQVGGTQVTLVDVFDDDGERQATVTVNGTGYTVGEGETFGRRFRLLDISGRCATMLFGDSRFTLCEGERIRK